MKQQKTSVSEIEERIQDSGFRELWVGRSKKCQK